MKKVLNHAKPACLLLLLSIALAAILGFLCGCVTGITLANIRLCIAACYLWFTAPFTVAAVLALFLWERPEWCVGFGAALYYGTVVLASQLRDFLVTSDTALYAVSFTIVSLICYIVWLKNFKSRYAEDTK